MEVVRTTETVENSAKRICTDPGDGGGGNGDVGGRCRWEGMTPEILALIFVRIVPVEKMVQAVPLVCRSWLEVVAGPYCWTEIDIEQWCRRCSRSDLVDSAVRKLVRRSKLTFRRLSAYKLGNPGFAFVANCAKCLKVLQIPMSDVTDKMVEMHAGSLANVTVLDISYCLKITSKGLQEFGENCKSLIELKRNMPPPQWGRPAQLDKSKIDNCEAMVIANTMPRLIHLELGFGHFDDCGLSAILTKCKSLTHLDIRGGWSVELEGDLERQCDQLPFFQSPWHDDDYDGWNSSKNDSTGQEDSDCGSFSDSFSSELDNDLC